MRATLFTPAEAAVLTGLSLKAVNNAIDRKTVVATQGVEGGRFLDARAMMWLSLERYLSARIAPAVRRSLFLALAGSRRNVVSLENGLLKIDLRAPRRELAASLRNLRRARHLVVSNAEVMAGVPVFRGTRVPVHMIAELVGRGSTPTELLDDYPRLTPEMIRLAPLYAAAYKLRGRPPKQPWRDRKPVHRVRRRIDRAAPRSTSPACGRGRFAKRTG